MNSHALAHIILKLHPNDELQKCPYVGQLAIYRHFPILNGERKSINQVLRIL